MITTLVLLSVIIFAWIAIEVADHYDE